MKQERKRILVRALGLALVLALAVAVVVGIFTLQRVRQRLASAQMALSQLENSLASSRADPARLLRDPEQLAALQSNLTTLDADLTALEDLSRPFLPMSNHLGWLPGIGGDVQAAPHLLAMARQTVDAAQALSSGLTPLAESLNQAEAGIGQLAPEIVRGLVEARPQIEAAQGSLARAAESRAALERDRLSPKTRAMVDRFDRYQPLLDSAVKALTVLPGLLGADGPRAYLLLAQNNQELRATGGFISGVGLVQIEGGQIAGLHFQDSYTVDDLTQPHPAPPAPLRREMGAGMLVLRDANWWPDFPTSAQKVADLYHLDQGQAVNGVIAVDLTTLDLLVQAVGPIEVPGYDQPVSRDNLQAMIMSYWQAPRLTAPGKEGTDWWLHRKDFAADLMSSMVTRLMAQATPEDLVAIAQSIGKALGERHLLVYAGEPETQALLREMGWDGAVRAADGDYLMIVDSNVGFNKVNPNIEQTVDYAVVLDEAGAATAKLTLTYRHLVQRPMPACVHESRYGDSYTDLLERCYWDYLRLYVPAGSELVEMIGADAPAEVYQESGRTVIATSFLLETGQARQIQVVYRPNLPAMGSRYLLSVQKQPGTEAQQMRVSITLPDGVQPTSVSPDGWVWLDDRAVWQGDLSEDREFELGWK